MPVPTPVADEPVHVVSLPGHGSQAARSEPRTGSREVYWLLGVARTGSRWNASEATKLTEATPLEWPAG